MRSISFVLILIFFVSCNRSQKTNKVEETRTSGTTELLVDESFARILDDQVEIFKLDYPDANIKIVLGNENKILPTFLNGKARMMVLSRPLKPEELSYYTQNKIGIYVDRFAIDGIALITNATNIDTNITTAEIFDMMKGISKSGKKLVFDNAYSSTIRYFKDSANVKELPKSGVYTLETNNDVIKYIAANKDYIGVVGVNWLLENNDAVSAYLPQVKTMGVKNTVEKNGANDFYKPTQTNLINGKYPFLRNVLVMNAEGRNGLGTGFANWLSSPRGQLIVLKSGLGPHKMLPREFNLKKNK